MTKFKRIWRFVKPYSWQLAGGFACTLLAVTTLLLVPGLLQNLVYQVQAGNLLHINTFLILGYIFLNIGLFILITIESGIWSEISKKNSFFNCLIGRITKVDNKYTYAPTLNKKIGIICGICCILASGVIIILCYISHESLINHVVLISISAVWGIALLIFSFFSRR